MDELFESRTKEYPGTTRLIPVSASTVRMGKIEVLYELLLFCDLISAD